MRFFGSRFLRCVTAAWIAIAVLNNATAQAQSVTYSYDALGRIADATYSNGAVIAYSYDAAGNRTQVVATSGAPNTPPVAINDVVSTAFGTPATFDPRTNDSDPQGGALTITATGTPSSGVAAIVSGGTAIQYVPAAGFSGAATFTYTISDPGSLTATATVTVNVGAPANQPPVAANDAVSTLSNAAVSLDPRTNDSDPEGGALTIVSVSAASSGSAAVTGGGTGVTYTPAANFTGTATFTYTVRDPQNATATATVTVTVNNRPPVAANDAVSTLSNAAVSLDPRTNDSDPEGGALTIVSVSAASSGSAVVTGGGTGVTYTPAANFTGTATFTYTVRDPQNATATATVTVTVNNQPPVATNDATTTNSNTAKSLDPRINDSDPEGGALTIISVGTPTSGSVVITGGGTGVTYTPASNFVGTASFTYTIRDPLNATAAGTVTVTVANQPPVAVNDAVSTLSGDYVAIEPRTNDSDPEAGALTIVSLGVPSSGSAEIIGANLGQSLGVIYTPATGFFGTATFTYTIRDPLNATSTATITVTVQNRAPTAQPDSTSTPFNTPKTLDPRTNDTDPENSALTVVSAGPASSGSAAVANGGAAITFTPAAGFSGTATVPYTIADPGNLQSTATVTVTVLSGANNPPDAVSDLVDLTAFFNEVTYADVPWQLNDSDPENHPLTVISVTQPANANQGSVQILGSGGGNVIQYTSGTNNVLASFSYTISDGNGGTDTATVQIQIQRESPD